MNTAKPRKVCVLLLKTHVDTYTRKDGTVVQAHDDKRQAKKFESGQPVMFSHPDRGRKVPGVYVGKRDGQSVVRHDEDGEIKVDHQDVFPREQAKDWRDEDNWHSRQMAKMKTHSEAELRYIIKDATEAAELAEKRGSTEKAGKYRDEAHYAAMELQKRDAPIREAKRRYDEERRSKS